jgi:hypothetical protein
MATPSSRAGRGTLLTEVGLAVRPRALPCFLDRKFHRFSFEIGQAGYRGLDHSPTAPTAWTRQLSAKQVTSRVVEIRKKRFQLVVVELQRLATHAEFLVDHEIYNTLAIQQHDGNGTLLNRCLHRRFGEIRGGQEDTLLVLALDRPSEFVQLRPGCRVGQALQRGNPGDLSWKHPLA